MQLISDAAAVGDDGEDRGEQRYARVVCAEPEPDAAVSGLDRPRPARWFPGRTDQAGGLPADRSVGYRRDPVATTDAGDSNIERRLLVAEQFGRLEAIDEVCSGEGAQNRGREY